MTTHTLTRRLAALFLTYAAARADFQNGQPAVLALGEPALNESFAYATGVAVDAATHKVFVSDGGKHRVLRFSSAESLQNGGAAEAVLGQPDFQSTGPGLSATQVNQPQGIAVSADGRLYVADRNNNRVLRFDNAATITSGSAADSVLGQVDFTHSGQNNATASNLQSPSALAVDPSGRLWVADTQQNRVLRFDLAGSKPPGSAADGVLGQAGFTTEIAAVSISAMNNPSGLAVDGTLRLWVADTGNNRVILFNNPAAITNGAAADKVLGEPDFLSISPPASTLRNRFSVPLGLAASGGTLWVADRDNWRVLRFDTAHIKSNGANADGVLGQSSYTTHGYGSTNAALNRPVGLALDGGRLWIVDRDNNRVLRHENAAFLPNGSSAASLLGDTSLVNPTYPSATRFAAGAKGIAVDPSTGKVFVCDTANHRVLRFASGAALFSGAAAEGVLGQSDFISNGYWNNLLQPTACTLDDAGHLWVMDSGNKRALRFTPALDSTFTAFSLNAQNQFTLTMSALVGETYELRSSPDLQDWTTIEGIYRATIGNPFGTLTWTAPTAAAGRRFYRLQAP